MELTDALAMMLLMFVPQLCDIDLETSLFNKQITSHIFNNGKFVDKDYLGISDLQLQYYFSFTSEGQSHA